MSAYYGALHGMPRLAAAGAHAPRRWPAHATPLPASVPVLMVGGDLDSLTPVTDAPHFVPGLGATRGS